MKSLRFLAFSMTVLAAPALWAQSTATVPEGYVTLTIAAGTGSVRSATIVSFPLCEVSTATGQTAGLITAVSTSTITNSNADWGTLATAASPAFIRITSGTAKGRTFLVASNTGTILTINTNDGASADAISVSGAGVQAGDSYQIFQGDTLFSVFGTGNGTGASAPLGNVNPALADTIQLNVGNSWQTYYYDPTQSAWINLASEAVSNNVVIRPDSAVIYNRLANSAYQMIALGSVPSVDRKLVVRSGQTTFISSFWPVATTLANTGLSSLPGWVANANPNLADKVQLRVGSSWKTYYHDGSNWIDLASEATSDAQAVGVGTGIIINKKATTTTGVSLSQTLPYNLN